VDLDKAMELLFPAEEDTVDELGLGRLSDAIAERLYPGTTVLMTRPKYLYLTAALYQHLEKANVTSIRFEGERKRVEDRTREALLRKTEEAVIGRRAKENLKRYPSSIYWRALATLGLLKQRLTQQEYLQRLSQAHANVDAVQTDDGTTLGEQREVSLWDCAGCADANRAIRAIAGKKGVACSLDLTRSEAKDLQRRYLNVPALKGSLLAYRLKTPRQTGPAWPWDCKTGTLELESWLGHAERVSTLARGATLQYFGLLLERRKDADRLELVRKAFTAWWGNAVPLLEGWKSDEALAVFPNSGMADDAPFLKCWTETITNGGSGKAAWSDAEARRLIASRDHHRARSRLLNSGLLQQWDARIVDRELASTSESSYRLNFRHHVGNRVVRDVAAALKDES
jgi:hypothetical protein